MNRRRIPYFDVFQSAQDGSWYWTLKGGNGEPMATGHEPFHSEANARRSIKRLKVVIWLASIIARKS